MSGANLSSSLTYLARSQRKCLLLMPHLRMKLILPALQNLEQELLLYLIVAKLFIFPTTPTAFNSSAALEAQIVSS